MLFPVRRCVDRLWRGMFQQSITKKAVGLVFICALAWYVIMGVLSFTSSTQSGGFQVMRGDGFDPVLSPGGVPPPISTTNFQPVFPSGVRKSPVVCILGVSKTIDTAAEVSKQWTRFHAFWVVEQELTDVEIIAAYDRLGIQQPSSDISDVLDGRTSTFQVVATGPVTWHSAITAAMAHVNSRGYPCEYYFLMHDDTKWFTNPSFKPSAYHKNIRTGVRASGDVGDELHAVLAQYRPAVLGFSWEYSDTQYNGAKECASKWAHHRVAPLTTLESGVGVYHASVAEFLLPFPPTGNDGTLFTHTPDAALSTVWVNMFVPLMFRSHALRLNTIRYTTRGRDRVKCLPHETLDTPEQLEYQKHLNEGLRSLSWGPFMHPADISWEPSVGTSPYSLEIVTKMSDLYDVSHPAIAGTLSRWQSHFRPRFRILVFTYNRVQSLKRLLQSLKVALYSPLYTIALQVFIDHSPATESQMRQVLSAYEWKHGPFETVYATSQKGLKQTIMSAWVPQHMSEFAIFLEDDIEVSPYFFEYARSCVEEYGHSQNSDTPASRHVLGCSLYTPIFSQVSNRYEIVNNDGVPYLMQEVSSWGAVFFPKRWRDFLHWYKRYSEVDPLIPNSYTNLWPVGASWKKYLIRMSFEQGLAMIFPSLPNNMTLSTNHLEPGTNDKGTGASAAAAKAKFTLPLLQYKDTLSGVGTGKFVMESLLAQPWDKLNVYDIYRQKLESYKELVHDMSLYDKATAVVYAANNPSKLNKTVAVYSSMPESIAEVVVMWNSVELPTLDGYGIARTATDSTAAVRVVVTSTLGFGPAGNANHRYLPIPGRKTWCIFSVESGVLLSRASVRDGLRVWKQSLDALVGFRFEARSLKPHKHREHQDHLEEFDVGVAPAAAKDVLPAKCKRKDSSKTLYNIILPVAVFFHARYLHAYTYAADVSGLDEVRLAIETTGTGSDLVFPIIVGMVGKQHPIVVDESETGNIIPSDTPASLCWKSAGTVVKMFEKLQHRENGFDKMLQSGVGVIWKGGEPRPVTC